MLASLLGVALAGGVELWVRDGEVGQSLHDVIDERRTDMLSAAEADLREGSRDPNLARSGGIGVPSPESVRAARRTLSAVLEGNRAVRVEHHAEGFTLQWEGWPPLRFDAERRRHRLSAPEPIRCRRKVRVYGVREGETLRLSRRLCGVSVEEVWAAPRGGRRLTLLAFDGETLSPPVQIQLLYRLETDE